MTRRLDPAASARRVDLGARLPVAGQRAAAAARAAHRSAKSVLAFYGSAEWKALMRRIIATRGRRCQDPDCETPNRGEGKKIYGDHVVEIADGGALLDANNIMLLCARCHGRKTAEAKRARGGAVKFLQGEGFLRPIGSSRERALRSSNYFASRSK
jgi:5-methylcytosine-specific restriction enzyme A